MPQAIDIDAAQLAFRYQLRLAGAVCNVASNSYVLGKSLSKWRTAEPTAAETALSLQIVVTSAKGDDLGNPHFRGLRHLVFASFGLANRFVFDLERHSVVATVSEEIAGNSVFWDRLLLPITMGVLGSTVGVVPVHAACLSVGEEGLLIAGASGAGKSTLAVALAKSGFGYLSDDWTYLSLKSERLVAHGMSVPAKLLPDAVGHFPELHAYRVSMALNQELAYELPPQDLGARVNLSCKPRWFIFLERTIDQGCHFTPIGAHEAHVYIERSVERLPAELDGTIQGRSAIIKQVSGLSCWKLNYSGSPEVAVRGLRDFVLRQREEIPA
jgi:hypothetical protein